MIQMKIDLNKIWERQDAISRNKVQRNRIPLTGDLECYVGLVGATGARMFQLALNETINIDQNYLRKFQGVEIQSIEISADRTEYTIILLDDSLTDIFSLFVSDLIESIDPISIPLDALIAINARVNYWRKLFSRVGKQRLSLDVQRGLYGELHFLQLLIKEAKDLNSVLASWRGIDSANQDFSKNRQAVEIKTTKANVESVHVANELQLDYEKWDGLYLIVVSVTESAGNLDSLCSLIQGIVSSLRLIPEALSSFYAKLEKIGITKEEFDEYDDPSFKVRKLNCYHVTTGFPILSENIIHNAAIFNVSYQVNLSMLDDYKTDLESTIEKLI